MHPRIKGFQVYAGRDVDTMDEPVTITQDKCEEARACSSVNFRNQLLVCASQGTGVSRQASFPGVYVPQREHTWCIWNVLRPAIRAC